MSYKDEVPKTDGLERYSGVMLTIPGNQHSCHVLGGNKGRTVFRAYPEIAEGAELPMRISADAYDFTSWLKAEKIIRMAGVHGKFTCLTRVKGKDRKVDGPIDRFIRLIRNTLEKSPSTLPNEWQEWKAQKGACPWVEVCGLLQGAMIENGGKLFQGGDGRPRPLHPVLLITTKTAREALESLCNEEVKGFQGSPEDYANRFASNDVVSSSVGHPLIFALVKGEKNMITHYKTAVHPKAYPIPLALIKNEFKPWDSLLYFMTEKEQVELLCKYFPSHAVDFAFQGTDLAPLMPAEVRGSWSAFLRKGVAAPAVAVAVAGAPAVAAAPTVDDLPAFPTASIPVAPATPGVPMPPPPEVASSDPASDVAPWDQPEEGFGGVDFGGGASEPEAAAVSPAAAQPVPAAFQPAPATAAAPAAQAPQPPVTGADVSRTSAVRARLAAAQAQSRQP